MCGWLEPPRAARGRRRRRPPAPSRRVCVELPAGACGRERPASDMMPTFVWLNCWLMLLALAPDGAGAAPRRPPSWDAVRQAINSFALIPNCHVVVGDTSGELFSHQKGGTGLDTEMRLFSATKWVSGVAIVAAIEDGLLGLDDLASQHLDYWTIDPEDARSRVTLRHLLGFVSGFSGGVGCGGLSLPECGRQIYETNSHTGEPGDRYAYNEVHLQLAAALTAQATGTPFVALVRRYVFSPAGGMPATRFTNEANPAAGAGLVSTPRDYHSFLAMYFRGELVAEAGRAEMERDQYPTAVRDAGSGAGSWHYGLANWYVCPEEVEEFGPACLAEDVHQSGGAAGFRPTTDRVHEYYYQIGYEGIPGLGNQFSLALHYVLKPLIDAQMTSRMAGLPTLHAATNTTSL